MKLIKNIKQTLIHCMVTSLKNSYYNLTESTFLLYSVKKTYLCVWWYLLLFIYEKISDSGRRDLSCTIAKLSSLIVLFMLIYSLVALLLHCFITYSILLRIYTFSLHLVQYQPLMALNGFIVLMCCEEVTHCLHVSLSHQSETELINVFPL